MIKMYNGEVLSKFPVVQHFPFGSLFSWDQDPDADPVTLSVHTANQPNTSQAGAPDSTISTARKHESTVGFFRYSSPSPRRNESSLGKFYSGCRIAIYYSTVGSQSTCKVGLLSNASDCSSVGWITVEGRTGAKRWTYKSPLG